MKALIQSPAKQLDKQAAYTKQRRQYWNNFAASMERWQSIRSYYQNRLAEIYSTLIPAGMRLLEVGCGQGDLLAALKPSTGIGIDLSPEMIARARQRHPHLQFLDCDAHEFDLGMEFDYVICSDLVNDVWDVEKVFRTIARHCHPSTRIVLNFYNRIWEVPGVSPAASDW